MQASANLNVMIKAERKAARFFEEAVRIDPELAFAQDALGVALLQKERYEEAVVCFRQVIRSIS